MASPSLSSRDEHTRMLAYRKASTRRHEDLRMTIARYIRENLATVIAATLVACGLVASLVLLRPRAATNAQLVARVHDGDGHSYELPLSEDGSLEVTTALGTNVISVQDGFAFVAEADCPKGDCLRQHAISVPGQQLICLPHQLWVEIVEQGAPDGELDVTAATSTDDIDLVSR